MASPIPSRQTWLTTALLTLAYIWSYVDRQLFGLLVEPIKASLRISDVQIGMINSISFSLFLLIAMIPLARLADRGNRPRLIAGCVGFWSIMTVACGAATHWLHLLVARTGVAIGEAGLPPAALAYLSDLVPANKLPRVTSIFLLGPFVGGGLALLGGSSLYLLISRWNLSAVPVLGGLEHWQWIFIIVGLPGFLIAAAILLTLKEVDDTRRISPGAVPLREVYVFFKSVRVFLLPYAFGVALVTVIYQSYVVWLPALLMRSQGLSMADAGLIAGGIFLGAGASGTLAGGWFVSLAREGRVLARATGVVLASAVALFPLGTLAPLASSPQAMAVLFCIAIFITSGMVSVSNLPLLIITPPRMRARMIGFYALIVLSIGPGGGPLAVGALSDHLGSLPKAMAIVALVVAIMSTLLLFLAWRAMARLPMDAS